MKQVIEENINTIRQTIQRTYAISPYDEYPQTIVVTKTQSFEDISKLYSLGFNQFAENRVEALLDRKKEFPQKDIVWHLIGTLQTRKVKQIVNEVEYIHSVDRIRLIHEIEKRASNVKKIFLQVNVFNEETKHGFSIDELSSVLAIIETCKHIEVVGLMTLAPFCEEKDVIRTGFSMLKATQLAIQKQQRKNCPCQYTSMGMSNDYDLAVLCGATHLRIGSAFFG